MRRVFKFECWAGEICDKQRNLSRLYSERATIRANMRAPRELDNLLIAPISTEVV